MAAHLTLKVQHRTGLSSWPSTPIGILERFKDHIPALSKLHAMSEEENEFAMLGKVKPKKPQKEVKLEAYLSEKLVNTLSINSSANILCNDSNLRKCGFSELASKHKSSNTENASFAEGPRSVVVPLGSGTSVRFDAGISSDSAIQS
jgi:hypothetical protein